MTESPDNLREPNDDWLRRWRERNIGWHHEAFNPHLLNHWPVLAPPAGSLVLAPLCGKSRDLVWLAQHGYRVRGIELSPLAVEAFFAEQGLQPRRQPAGPFECWRNGPYEIYCGDIFDLPALDNRELRAVYDRASLVALNPRQRQEYAGLLKRVLPDDCAMLLVAMDYPQEEMGGPPYSVTEAEVRGLFADRYRIDLLYSCDLLAEGGQFRDKGLSRLLEQIYYLRPACGPVDEA